MIALDIDVEADGWHAIPDVEAWCRRAADAALAAIPDGVDGTATLLLADDAFVQDLNRQWRGIDRPTNVLSFPAPALAGPDRHLGDIAIAFETTSREAGAEDKSLADHTAHLVMHGLLHLLGHDHDTDPDAERMERVETRALSQLGIADPYRVQA